MGAKANIKIQLHLGDESGAGELRKQLRALLTSAGMLPVWQEVVEVANSDQRKFTNSDQNAELFINGKKILHFPKITTQTIDEIKSAAKTGNSIASKSASFLSVIPGIFLVFLPKCAFCWAAYASAFNSLGLTIPYMPWLRDVFAGLLILSIFLLYRGAKRRKKWFPFFVQLSGMLLVLLANYVFHSPIILWTGIVTIFTGSLLNAMPDAWLMKLQGFHYRLFSKT